MTATLTAPVILKIGPRPWRWTVEDYYKLGNQGFFQEKRVELIHGEIVELSPLGWPHSLATGLVFEVLSRAFKDGYFLNVQSPFSIPGLRPASVPEPDVTVVPGSRRDYTNHPAVAALIVEVADTSLDYDTTTKAELYAAAGVPEYWVLDLNGKQLLVFRDPAPRASELGVAAYQKELSLGANETVSPLAVPASRITVSEMLP